MAQRDGVQMPWFKWWDGTAADPKFRMLAEQCQQSVAAVLGVWSYLLEHASRSEDRGHLTGLDMTMMAYTLMLPVETVETVCNGMKRVGLVTSSGEIMKWEKRQAKRENQEPAGSSTKRVQALRARQRAVNGGDSGDGNAGNDDGTGGTDETTRNDMKRPKRKSREEVNLKPKPSSSSGDDGVSPFDLFWTAYPHKVGKVDAQKAWAKLNPDDCLLADIMAAIEAQKAGQAWRRDGGEYIPHPGTWLRGGRWLDEVRPYADLTPWWESREAMVAKGASLVPRITPNHGELPGDFRRRIADAISSDGNAPQSLAPTPYTPPAPMGGESTLTQDQLTSRREELLALARKGSEAARNRPKAGAEDHDGQGE